MNIRILAIGSIGLTLLLGQEFVLGAQAAEESYTVPMTPWGEPDLRGTWPINHLIGTPLVRDTAFGNSRFLSNLLKGRPVLNQGMSVFRVDRFLLPMPLAGQCARPL